MRIDKINESIPLWDSIDSKAGEFLGSHLTKNGWVFRVWAPHAAMVYLTGEFCGWEARANPMHRISENGVWESEPMQLDTYTSYKYVIETHDGRLI